MIEQLKNLSRTCFPIVAAVALCTASVHANVSNKRFEDVEALIDNIENHKDVSVTVPGEVERIEANSFVLEGGGIINDEIFVVYGKNVDAAQKALVLDDADLWVKGTVKKGSVIETERDLGYTFEPMYRDDLARVGYYIVAEEITRKAE